MILTYEFSNCFKETIHVKVDSNIDKTFSQQHLLIELNTHKIVTKLGNEFKYFRNKNTP